MGRTTLIAVIGAVVVGSTGGGLAALHFTSPRPRASQVAAQPTPAAGPSAAVISDAAVADPDAPAVSGPTAHASLTTQMSAVLTRFAAWSRSHAGAPCPDLATLGLAAHDPWGHDLTLTSTDQPADQVIGVVSAGPDGVIGTDDDVASWTLGPGVTSLVRGPRWKSAPHPLATRPPPRRRIPLSTTATHTPVTALDHAPVTVPERTPTPPAGMTPARPTPPRPDPTPDPSGDDIPARRSSR